MNLSCASGKSTLRNLNHGSGEPLLTICIPSYNRGSRVFSLVSFLLGNVTSKYDGAIELVVVNNCSTDDTELLLKSFSESEVRVVNRDVHFPSAEANMFASLEFCNGRYVWFHGDDDIPVPETIDWLIQNIESNDVDMYVFNTQLIDVHGAPISDRTLKINQHFVDITGDDLVFACGFSYSLAGVSNVVFRRSMADLKCIEEICGIQEIYSHVTWLIRCYAKGAVRLSSKFLVYYRNDDPEKTYQHFQKYAKKTGIPDRFVWGVGLAGHLMYLVDTGTLTYKGIAAIYDGRRDGTRFRLVDEIIMQIFLQVKNYIEHGADRQYISRDVFSLVKSFLYRVDLFLYDILSVIDNLFIIAEKRKSGAIGGLRAKKISVEMYGLFEEIFYGQLEPNFYRQIYVCRFMNYTIYRTPCVFVAIADSSLPERARILSYIDPVDERLEVLVESSISDVEEKIRISIGIFKEKLMESAHLSIPLYEISGSLRDLSDSAQLISKSKKSVSDLRHLSTEMLRQSTFVFRLVFWRILFSPLRYALRFARNIFNAARMR